MKNKKNLDKFFKIKAALCVVNAHNNGAHIENFLGESPRQAHFDRDFLIKMLKLIINELEANSLIDERVLASILDRSSTIAEDYILGIKDV